MRKITNLMLTLALLFGAVGGVKAGKTYASCSVANACTWDATTNTMGFTAVNGWQILLTGLPSGDITEYTKFHATLSSMSDNIENIRLCIKENDNNPIYVNLVQGENNINLQALAAANPTVDFTKIKDITLWSPSSAASGKTVDGEHPASVKIENVYLQTVKNITNCTLKNEITAMSYLTAGNRFVIANTEGTQIQSYPSGGPEATSTSLNSVTSELYYYFTIDELPALDIDNNGENDDAKYYRIAIENAAGTAKPTNYWHGNYIDRIGWGSLWSTSCQADGAGLGESAYGRDGDFNAVWTITYESGNGFVIFNPKNNQYMTLNGTSDNKTYLKLYQSLDLTINSEFDKEDNAANDQIFALANAIGYNVETGEMENPTWTFETPIDISDWDYLMITTVNNPSSTGGAVTITDDNGVSVGGENYSGGTAGTGGNMWLDRWNNQNAIRISIDYLRIYKGMDITKIKSLTINGTTKIANIYLTDYNNTKVSGGYKDGDEKREYSETGKFGTICLPYKASYAGAEVYSITGSNASSISLERVHGLLEAGKPYFYVSADESGQDNGGIVRNVNFFRADLEKYDVSAPVPNNGLIGTFTATTAPQGDNYYVLSKNKLYQVDSDVNVGANKAYVDLSAIVDAGAGARSINLMFNEPTGINTVSAEGFTGNGEFYNLQGQRVSAPRKGLYIVNGKVIVIK